MGLWERIKVLRSAAAPVKGGLPALAPPSGVSGASVDFTASSDGRAQKLVWARYTPAYGFGAPYAVTMGGFPARERNAASAVATDFATRNPVIATLIENLATHNVGNGLTLSSKLDAAALGISPETARKLGSQIEKAWARYAKNPLAVDLTGRHTLHELALAGFKTWLRTGEVLATLDWQAAPGSNTRTKVSLLDPKQLDQTKTAAGPDADKNTLQGVIFDKKGRVVGYKIIPHTLGAWNITSQSLDVAAFTSFGRQRVIHLFELITAGQVRGLSPLVAALTPSQEQGTLGEFTLDAALLQTQYALTIESALPAASALQGLDPSTPAFGAQSGLTDADRLAIYEKAPVKAEPGVINYLPPGDKLHIHRSETPNATFEPFNKSLSRSAAKAAGSSYEDTSGDYGDVNFSASRMASETPHRINMRRRMSITERFYRAVYTAWLEEVLNCGMIELPAGAPPFWQAADLYTESKWLGAGRVQPDPLKAAEATKLELEMGLTTLTDALAERGHDFETVLEERKAERDQLRAAGFTVGSINHPTNDNSESDDDARSATRRRG